MLRPDADARLGGNVQEAPVTESNDRKIADDGKISEDRREALRYALAIGSGADLSDPVSRPPLAPSSPAHTLEPLWRL